MLAGLFSEVSLLLVFSLYVVWGDQWNTINHTRPLSAYFLCWLLPRTINWQRIALIQDHILKEHLVFTARKATTECVGLRYQTISPLIWAPKVPDSIYVPQRKKCSISKIHTAADVKKWSCFFSFLILNAFLKGDFCI